MIDLPLLPRRKTALNEQQKKTLVKIISCIAWADGKLLDEEKSELARTAGKLGGVHVSVVEEILASVKVLDDTLLDEIRQLPTVESHMVIKAAFRIANADGEIHPKELAVIETVAGIILPDKPWEAALDWIMAYDAFMKASKALFS